MGWPDPNWWTERGNAWETDGWLNTQGSSVDSRDAAVFAGIDNGWTDYHFKTRFNALGGGNKWYNSYIYFRVANFSGWVGGTYYLLSLEPADSTVGYGPHSYQLTKAVNSVFTQLSAGVLPSGYLDGYDNVVDINVAGGQIDIALNGLSAISLFDANPISSGGIGVGSVWESRTQYDYAYVNGTGRPLPEPTPEPASLLAMAGGFGLIVRKVRRR